MMVHTSPRKRKKNNIQYFAENIIADNILDRYYFKI